MRIAIIESGIVINIILGDEDFLGLNAIDVSDLKVSVDDLYDGTTFTKPVVVPEVDTNIYMDVVADVVRLAPTETVTFTTTLKDSEGVLVDVNSEYLVPIIRKADGLQTDLVSFQFVGGECTVSVVMVEKGIYVIDMDKISPLPTAILDSDIEVVVL